MSLRSAAAALKEGLLDLVFAPVCLGCDHPIVTSSTDRLVCAVCWSRMRGIPLPRCDRCWSARAALPGGMAPLETCPTCSILPPSLRSVRSAFVMTGPARNLVHSLKYGGWHAVARPMGMRMARLPAPVEVKEEVAVVVPVPISRTRLRERGYNQAELLACSVGAELGLSVSASLLERTRTTDTQTTLHPTERRANVAGAFRVRAGHAEGVRREHVLLVDDVWTTGATALECASALIDAGARAVSVLTFGRALPDLRS